MIHRRSIVCAGRCIRAVVCLASFVCAVQRMHEPCAVAPFYGWLTWLNRDGRLFADASHSSWFMFGAGGHLVWIDPDNEAGVVARWLDGAHSAGFVRRVAQALRS